MTENEHSKVEEHDFQENKDLDHGIQQLEDGGDVKTAQAQQNSDCSEKSRSDESFAKENSNTHEISPDRIDLNAMWVVRRLRAKGHEAYLTGGCVRDLLLNRTPKDFDVATSARPEEVKSIFRNCRLIGRRFLLAHVVFPGNKIIETATFRANPSEEVNGEGEESDDLLVMQDNVYGTMKEDAFRRDLTINGLFYDPVEGKVIDYVGGCEDLAKGVIRTIGDPDVRLQEDPVRILRAIRFAERLGFSIDETTFNAMKEHAQDILRCAPARLQEEVVRLLISGHALGSMKRCLEIGILDYLMPELLEGLGLVEGELACTQKREELLNDWHNMLGGLDRVREKDCHIVSSVAFTALLFSAYLRLEKSEFNERNWIDRLCVNWAERIRLTRRDQDIIRILLSAIPLFHVEKVHQKSAHYLVRKPWFREGLLTFIIYLVAHNEPLEQIKIWKLLAKNSDKNYRQDKVGMRPVQNRFRKRRPPMRNQFRRFNKKSTPEAS
ncbi:MAG: polynucleotide adenylyltransferase PcnB [Myxococcales bacterium]|nr:polynucleotide adenylyltransferase PcnB [Myxococcales bacterium]USN51068.1 MAG: polynucleotide adenylyltransferase PcnB [Myxococcales bacterium]